MRYILNSAVITGPGAYEYRLVSEQEAATWIRAGKFVSRVGYPNTADQYRKDLRRTAGPKPGGHGHAAGG